jgi:hypothetical protein
MNGLDLAISPLFGWPWLAGCALFGLAILCLMALRRAEGILWRAIALALLLACALNPALIEEKREAQPDIAVIIVDRSFSQSLGRRQERTQTALDALQRRLAAERGLETRIVFSDDTAEAIDRGEDGAAEAEETRLAETWHRAAADLPRDRLAALFIITDGQVHDAHALLKDDRLRSAPVHVLLTGERKESDRRLTVVRAPAFGIVGQSASVALRVDDLGAMATGPDDGRALIGVRVNGQSLPDIAVPLGQEFSLPIQVEHGGQNVVEMTVSAGPQELSMANNRAILAINGVRDRLRVLLISGEPHPGERTWRNLLKADPAVDLVHFTILRSESKRDAALNRELSLIAFPARELFETKLKDFDLIIFDRYKQSSVISNLYLKNIADYVVAGGALLEIGGPFFAQSASLYNSPLAAILPGSPLGPVWEEGFLPRITPLGQRHPVTAGLAAHPTGDGPWGRWLRMVPLRATGGDIVMEGLRGSPLLILQRVGSGRVAQLASDHIWLWSRGFEGGGPQAELLRRLAHWLMKEPDLEENDLKVKADGMRIRFTRQSLLPDERPLSLVAPDGSVRTVVMQQGEDDQARGSILADQPGLWRLQDGSREKLVAVGRLNPPELMDLRTIEEALAPVVQASHGGFFWLADGEARWTDSSSVPSVRRLAPSASDKAGRDWLGLNANGGFTVQGSRRLPLLGGWIGALVLVALAGALLAAWRREGHA